MKTIIAILITVLYCLLCSCYTKNKAIKKFCKQDSIVTFVTVHDTVTTQTIQADTTLSSSNTHDTIVLVRDKMVIKYYKKDSIVYLQGTCQGDTIYIQKTVKVSVPVTVPKLSWLNQFVVDYKWWILFIIGLLIVLVFYRR